MLINLISIALFASWPQYLPIFLQSARYNPDVRFTLITNLDEHHSSWHELRGNITKPSNVVFAPYTFDKIVEEIHKDNLGLGVPLTVNNPYKLIDFKPMYGVLFRKELEGYSHWGWFDLDIFVGNIRATFECGYANEDFVSYDPAYRVQGPLMVLRNTELVNTFYLNMLSYPRTVSAFKGAPTIIFDEKHMPYLIKRNGSVVLKTLPNHNCEGYVWMWYKGDMQNAVGPCVVHHFGGGGTKLSGSAKASTWHSASMYFDGYHVSGEYGYGEIQRPKMSKFCFIFNFTTDNEFKIVQTSTSMSSALSIQKYTEKYTRQLRSISARFLLPNSSSQCKHSINVSISQNGTATNGSSTTLSAVS